MMFSCSLSSSPSFSGQPLATTRLRRKRRSDMKDNARGVLVKVFAKKREEKDKNYPN